MRSEGGERENHVGGGTVLARQVGLHEWLHFVMVVLGWQLAGPVVEEAGRGQSEREQRLVARQILHRYPPLFHLLLAALHIIPDLGGGGGG